MSLGGWGGEDALQFPVFPSPASERASEGAYHFHHVRAPLGQQLQALQRQVEELPVLGVRLLGLLAAGACDNLEHQGASRSRPTCRNLAESPPSHQTRSRSPPQRPWHTTHWAPAGAASGQSLSLSTEGSGALTRCPHPLSLQFAEEEAPATPTAHGPSWPLSPPVVSCVTPRAVCPAGLRAINLVFSKLRDGCS